MERLPLPEISEQTEFQHSFKQVHRREECRLRPPKLKHRYCHDSNGNRSSHVSMFASGAHAISFGDNGELCEPDTLPLSPCHGHVNGDPNASYFEQSFTSLAKIGEGSFGEVFKVRSKEDDHLYAVKMSKQMFRSGTYRHERLEEVRRYQQLSGHANCVQFYRAWEQDDRLYMQMELCRESLESYLMRERQIPEPKVWSILLDLLLALKSLHDLNLIHLDIKLDNVLIGDDDLCKLADFGLVIDVQEANVQATEGDSRYIAPEIMSGQFTKAADIFSLGIAMLELACCLELPSNGPLWQQLRSGQLPENFIQAISVELRAIIKRMMHPDPGARPSVDELLQHQKLDAMLRQRQRWLTLRKIKHSLLGLPRFVWSSSLRMLKSASGLVLDMMAIVMAHKNGLLAAHEPSTPLSRPTSPPPHVARSVARSLEFPVDTDKPSMAGATHSSTPIRPLEPDDGTKSAELNESKARARIDFVSAVKLVFEDDYNLELELDSSIMFESTPRKQRSDMFASTPLNHHAQSGLRTRQRKLRSFNNTANGKGPTSVLDHEMELEESDAAMRKSFDLVATRAKKLFLDEDVN